MLSLRWWLHPHTLLMQATLWATLMLMSFVCAPVKVTFYAARYDQRLLGIFPVGDLTKYIPDAEADIAIMEEPEHLTWFHHGERWSSKFRHVVRLLELCGQLE